MKNSYLFLLIPMILGACSSGGWSSDEKSDLKDRCRLEGGSRTYCNCYLENAMNSYASAEEMEGISFEKAVELSINCK